MMERFDQTYSYKLIYVFSMPYETHKGLLKVGEATLNTDIKPVSLVPNCHALNQAAKARIDSYTKTASMSYKLEYRSLYSKFSELLSNKTRFVEESAATYKEALDKYQE